MITRYLKTAEEIKSDLFSGNYEDIYFTSDACLWKQPGNSFPENYQFQFEERDGTLFLHLISKDKDFTHEYRIFNQKPFEGNSLSTYWLLSDSDEDSIILCPKN